MNIHLQQLIELSQIDKEIDAYEPKIASVNQRLESIYNQQEEISTSITTLNEDIQAQQDKKLKNDAHLQELSAKLDENSKKSAEVKTEREMKSLQLEEEIAKEQITFANEEIERLDKVITSKTEEVEELSQKLEDVDSRVDEIKTSVDTELAGIEQERNTVYVKKQELVSKMNQKGLSFYEKIRRWAKNTTAVPVKDQACYGCFIKISDKVYSEVIKGEEIITCPHCGRILYLEPEGE